MPDIPLDFLFIIGLVIASFIGKLGQRKRQAKPSTSQGNPSEQKSERGLEDVIKEAWERLNKPQESELEQEIPPPMPVVESKLNNIPDKVEKAVIQPAQKAVIQPAQKAPSTVTTPDIARFKSITDQLSESKHSVRKAFVLKEILDKPKSLRSFSP